ncbi:MAG: hypothetical protein KGK07_13515 [Chloroflexota bacterium]|nr:hypothetical protein [Chloroflexota bacterium]
MVIKDVFSIATAIIVLAGLSMAILHGGETARVIEAGTNGFASLIKAATVQG